MKRDIETSLRIYNEQFARDRISQEKLDHFCSALKEYISEIKKAEKNNQIEEYYKGLVNTFLKSEFYADKRYIINTDGRHIDSAIKDNGNLRVIIEAKSINNRTEFPTDTNIICKGLSELVYYYLFSTRDVSGLKAKLKPDVEIRRLILTNSLEWYLFDANDFEKLCSGYLENLYFKFANKQLTYSSTDKLYPDIEAYLRKQNVTTSLNYIMFSITDLINPNTGKAKGKITSSVYKLLDYHFLLKEPYSSVGKTHVLNNRFYKELLYVMGLKEEQNNNKTTIVMDNTARNTIGWQLFKMFTEYKEYPETKAKECTLELMILWINRLLFIKLFEGQLIQFNGDKPEYQILSLEKIHSFLDVQYLFFRVLGKKDRETSSFFEQFTAVPYLNSSLFERQQLEIDTYNISDLRDEDVEIPSNSVLKKKGKTNLRLLEYIISFLSCYDFGAQGTEQGGIQKSKDIIDASVLGLIFEKINGYKDGSFYTPSFITEYIAKETLEQIVVEKMNAEFSWQCSDYEDLLFTISANKSSSDMIIRANKVINNIRIIDPAVGSGHFLVSALNRLLAIKHDLGIILVHNSAHKKVLSSVDIFVQDDTLIVSDAQGNSFKYIKNDIVSQEIQETLFEEKRVLIQNCLFGVDINPKAVAICQLRLWIELLKNAYYKDGVMETLPNIDINIKEGNSLVNLIKFDVGNVIGYQKKVKSIAIPRKMISDYRKLIQSYHDTSDKTEKTDLKESITKIKNHLSDQFSKQISMVITKGSIVSLDTKTDIDLYRNKFEWAIEFPEIISDDGHFNGFDCVIGNPPYIDSETMVNNGLSYERDYIRDKFEYAKGNWDIYIAFFERGLKLLNSNGVLTYITPDKWISKSFGDALRKAQINNIQQIVVAGRDVFDSALVDSIITTFSKKTTDTLGVYSISDEKILKLRSINKGILQNPYALDIVFSESIDTITRMENTHRKLGDIYQCESACSTSDCYILKDILYALGDGKFDSKTMFRVINTGLIGRYVDRWNDRQMTYVKAKYRRPYVLKDEFESTFPNSYGKKASLKKIVIKGLTLLDASLDLEGLVVPGKSTMYIPCDDIEELKLLCAYINSKVAIFYIKQRYSSSSYNGGINFSKEMINSLPWPELSSDEKNQIISLVDKICALKLQNANADTSQQEQSINRIYINKFDELTEEEKQMIIS